MNPSEKKEHIYERWEIAQRIEGSTRLEDLNNSKQTDQTQINPITLFTGQAEKEKNLAAEALANQLNLDLYRIDLSNLIGKYIGETEKNLIKLINPAEKHEVILYLESVEGLLGRQSEILRGKDPNSARFDIEHLSNRIKALPGLVILALKDENSLHPELLKRVSYKIDFSFSD